MKKQYAFYEHTKLTHIVEKYHDGVLQNHVKVLDDELDAYLDRLEADGYVYAMSKMAAKRIMEKYG